MICIACHKESKNLRVCPFCFTPYPAEAAQKRQSQRVQAAGSPLSKYLGPAQELYLAARAVVMRQTPLVRWSGAGIVVIVILWMFSGPSDPRLQVGVVQSDIIASPIEREEALAIIKQTRENALVDIQADEVFVSYPAATFPVRGEGQLALAQQFARADEVVEGRKRRIFFYNPNGKLFAQTDGAAGVVLTR
jgi:hypothetical protein